MISKVNLTILSPFLGLFCLSKLIIRLTHDVFLISLLFRFVSSLNHIHLPLSVHDQKGKSYNIKTVSRLVLFIQVYY